MRSDNLTGKRSAADRLVELEGVTKTYRLQHETSLKSLRRRQDRASRYHRALTDVSLTCGPGEVVGLIGPNGAGKSTLLKLLSRITVPDSGRIAINGRVASLLEVGAGFHPELTGRENIHLNGAILGMTPAAIEERFDAIVEFANVARFLDTPVKRFSSGMRVRLAIAVALHLDSDIVILDEVLAVGDTAFQQRCLGLLEDMAKRGTKATIVVSHNMATISSICSRAILLEGGSVAFDGDVESAIEKYFQAVTRTTATAGALAQRTNVRGDGHPLLLDVVWSHGNTGRFVCGGPWAYDVSVDHGRLEAGSTLRTTISADGGTVLAQSTHPLERMEGDASTFTVTMPRLPLLPGRYLLGLGVEGSDGVMADEVHGALSFDVLDPSQTGGESWAAVAANPGVLLATEIAVTSRVGAPLPV